MGFALGFEGFDYFVRGRLNGREGCLLCALSDSISSSSWTPIGSSMMESSVEESMVASMLYVVKQYGKCYGVVDVVLAQSLNAIPKMRRQCTCE